MSNHEYDPKDPFQVKRIEQQLYAPGKIFDVRSFWGNVRGIIFGCLGIYVGWHSFDLLAWWDSLWGVAYEIDPVRQSWVRLWTVIFGGIIVAGGIMAMIFIPINRRRAARSAVGQWYDDPALTREALHGEQGGSAGQDADSPDATDSAPRDERPS